MTQKDLAKSAGIAPNTLSALENKGQGLKTEIFIRLCRLVDADPREVADQAYYYFRASLGEQADQLAAGDVMRSAIPSLAEIIELYDAEATTRRSLFLAIMSVLRPDKAVSAFFADRIHELDTASDPPRSRPRQKGRPRRKS